MWLIGKLSPDHKTIALFRSENAVALKRVFRDFVGLCVKPGLYGKELVATLRYVPGRNTQLTVGRHQGGNYRYPT
jgi:hypothetical protein